jgi:hypothetical protein
MTTIIAGLCSLYSPASCSERTVTTSDFADISIQSCLVGAPQLGRVDEATSSRAPGGMALCHRQTI